MRGSIHVTVEFNDGHIIRRENGYSKIGNLDSNRAYLRRMAIYNAAYCFVYHGGSYEYDYEVISMSILTTREKTSQKSRKKYKYRHEKIVKREKPVNKNVKHKPIVSRKVQKTVKKSKRKAASRHASHHRVKHTSRKRVSR